ncbi:MAG: hypothetical protein ACK4OO_01010 [bacterium]
MEPISPLLLPIPVIALYAETHYRFRYFPFSLYYRREPEILFDAPTRLDTASPLPVALIIKDAHRFPIHLERVVMELGYRDEQGHYHPLPAPEFPLDLGLNLPLWHRIFELEVEQWRGEELEIIPILYCRVRGREKRVRVDNYPGLKRQPLKVYLADRTFALLSDWHPGEIHCHTSYGDDFVEFGAPLEVIGRLARAMGIRWVAITDHSYNLDDPPGDPSRHDPDLPKWHSLRKERDLLSRDLPLLLIGEEVTVRNSRGRNVHLIVIGSNRFYPGSGDSAERWFQTRSELSVPELLQQLEEHTLAIAAHPLTPTPKLEALLIGRGKWEQDDLAHPRLDLWQIVNGEWDEGYRQGKAAWLNRLAQGIKVNIVGGNDAHGNFNLFRQVKLPMIALRQGRHHLFGKVISYLYCPNPLTDQEVISHLKRGEVMVSDGLWANLNILPSQGSEVDPSTPTQEGKVNLRVEWASHPLWGWPHSVKIFGGTTQGERMWEVIDQVDPNGKKSYRGEMVLQLPPCEYYRGEISSRGKREIPYQAITNAIWLKNHKVR